MLVPADARQLPRLPLVPSRALRRPISFVTVHFSDEIGHNLLLSPCVGDAFNQLIVVDNRENLFFPTLGAALLQGLAQARNDLVVAVHEDVLLLPGWQHAFDDALDALERHDPEWGVVGVVGWDADGHMVGHWSDPRGYRELMHGQRFAEVERIDEQVIVLRKSAALRPDPALPSIHNIGRDLPRAAAELGRRSYVVDAPSVHKFADHEGRPILHADDSRKIRDRGSRTYLSDRACSDAYLQRKWTAHTVTPAPPPATDLTDAAPLVLLARGGGGSRLLSTLAQDCGVFIGSEVSDSGDSLELVDTVYRLVLSRLRYRDSHLCDDHEAALRHAVSALHLRAGHAVPWGFKLPELMLLPDVLLRLFPRARFVHMVRDPLATCLRRTHMTARTDNQVGQASLLAAYRHAGLGADRILTDSPAMHMAVTTRHQIETVMHALDPLPSSQCLTLRFEDVMGAPDHEKRTLRDWLTSAGRRPRIAASLPFGRTLEAKIDPRRAAHPATCYPADVEQAVAADLAPLRRRLGYLR